MLIAIWTGMAYFAQSFAGMMVAVFVVAIVLGVELFIHGRKLYQEWKKYKGE